MARGKAPKSWADQLADLDDPAPKELDPEDDAGRFEQADGSDSAGDDGDEIEARGHYTDIGKSKLRKADDVDLGPRYTGASISREALTAEESAEESEDDPFGRHSEQEESERSDHADPDGDLDEQQSDGDEEIDSGEAFESGDEEKFANFTFGDRTLRADRKADGVGDLENGGSGDENVDEGVHSTGSVVEDEDDDSDYGEMDTDGPSDSSSDNTSLSNDRTGSNSEDRAALRTMMAEEQKTVAASLSKAAKADVTKGRAIKHQRTTFDSLLNTRIKLQKALIATNSMRALATELDNHPEAIEAAEKAALKLWDTLSELRSSLQPPTSKSLPSTTTTTSTPSKLLWGKMHEFETPNIPKRRANLTKWSQKTNPTTALPRAGKFSQAPSQQPLTSILDQHLSGPNAEKLLQKTRVPRSCAPVQLSARIPSDPSIYDDADFYTLLLRELVDQRMTDSATAPPAATASNGNLPPLPSSRQFKVKKPVDTKASKGRKMRYTVHEKLQNFMAPEDLGRWGERQRRELFGSLFGRGVTLAEDQEGEEMGREDEVEERVENGAGLRLFA